MPKRKTPKDAGKGKSRATPNLAPGERSIKLDKAQKAVKKDVQGGRDLSDILGFNDPLSRIDTSVPADQQAYLDAVRGMSDPNSPSFVGTRSDEEKRGISRLDDLYGQASVDDTQRTAETADVIKRAQNEADMAGQRSTDMQDVLNLMKQGLAGLSAPENQALREQAQREVDRKAMSARDQAMSAARMGGMRGGALQAAERNIRRDTMGAQADLEQKNLLANIDIQDKRRNDYASNLNTAENSEFGRGNTALNTYDSAVTGAEDREAARRNDRFGRMQNAANSYSQQVNSLTGSEQDRTRQAMGDYGNAMNMRDQSWLDKTKINMGQERTDRAAQAQSSLGLSGLIENERQRRRALGSRRSVGDGRINPNGAGGVNGQAPYDPMDYYNAVQGIYKDAGYI